MIRQVLAPLRILRALTASANLPVYELDRGHVQKKSAHIRPFLRERGFTKDPLCPTTESNPPELSFSGWRLAHAVKKAECLRQMPFEFVSRLGFLLEQLPTFDWRQDNLRLLSGVAGAYADFAGSSLAGRIAQGIALLFMDARAYAFAAHYPRVAGARGPDFIFEHQTDRWNRVLVEAKGAFVTPQGQPNIKGLLAEGLDQISKANPLGSKKSFVVGSFLRENGDQGEEPSLVAFVDPEDDRTNPRDEPPPSDFVLRHNYAAWLDAMGLHYTASDLRARIPRSHPERVHLHILTLNGTSFGVVPLHIVFPDDWEEPFHPWPWRHGRLVVAGLPMPVLDRIRVALAASSALLTMDDEMLTSIPRADHEGEFKGSILRDGSLLGSLPGQAYFSLRPEEIPL